MPRVATAPISRSRKSPVTGGKIPPASPHEFRCPEKGCSWSYRRESDLRRHQNSHLSPQEKERKMFHCEVPGCAYKALQMSNLRTHRNAKHTGRKPHACEHCSYRAADPSCLYKHRRRIHGYTARSAPPKARGANVPTVDWWETESAWTPSPSPGDSPAESYESSLSPPHFVGDYPPSPTTSTSECSWDFDFEAACLELVMHAQANVYPTADPAAPSALYPAEQAIFAPGFVDAAFSPTQQLLAASAVDEFDDDLESVFAEYVPPSPSWCCSPTAFAYDHLPYTGLQVYTPPEFQVEWDGVRVY